MSFPALSDLSFAPSCTNDILQALKACPVLSSLTLILSGLSNRKSAYVFEPSRYDRFVGRLQRLRHLCLCGIPGVSEAILLQIFDDKRFINLTFDYQDRPRTSGAKRCRQLVSPCEALAEPLHVALSVREGVCELEFTDTAQRRRVILLDAPSIARTRGLWDYYIRDKAVHSATVDALAWQYFVNDMPQNVPISTLTLTVAHSASELDAVSLAPFAGLSRLAIETLKPGIAFSQDAVRRLLASRASMSPHLATLSLARGCDFGPANGLAGLAALLER